MHIDFVKGIFRKICKDWRKTALIYLLTLHDFMCYCKGLPGEVASCARVRSCSYESNVVFLLLQGGEGVPEVISTMATYDLTKEDWDAMQELAHFTGRPDRVSQIPSNVNSTEIK